MATLVWTFPALLCAEPGARLDMPIPASFWWRSLVEAGRTF
jgi:hypothetical protein